MNKLQCELCGSIDIVKIDEEMFQCQFCGCKYTVASLKKMLSGVITVKSEDFEVVGGKLVSYRGASTEVEIPNTVAVIGAQVFKDYSSITKIIIPNSVKEIEYGAFEGCSSLEQIIIPDSVKKLGLRSADKRVSETFKDCISLVSVQLSAGMEHIPALTFSGCSNLKEVIIPDGIKTIDYTAFKGCQHLVKLTLPTSLQDFTSEEFNSVRLSDCLSSIQCVEGNSKPFFNLFVLPNLGDYNPKGSMERTWPPVIHTYVEQIISERKQNNVCVDCGGAFTGRFRKICSVCGRAKTY